MLIYNRKHLEFGGSVRLHDVAKVQNKLTQQSPHFPTFHDKCLGYTGHPSLARCNTLSSDMCVLLFLVYIIKLNLERERERGCAPFRNMHVLLFPHPRSSSHCSSQ